MRIGFAWQPLWESPDGGAEDRFPNVVCCFQQSKSDRLTACWPQDAPGFRRVSLHALPKWRPAHPCFLYHEKSDTKDDTSFHQCTAVQAASIKGNPALLDG